MRSDRERLLDILEAVEKIEQRKAAQKPDFDADEMLQDGWYITCRSLVRPPVEFPLN